jgi:hypothetical protein
MEQIGTAYDNIFHSQYTARIIICSLQYIHSITTMLFLQLNLFCVIRVKEAYTNGVSASCRSHIVACFPHAVTVEAIETSKGTQQ